MVCVGTASEKPEKRRCPPVSARIACVRRGRHAGAVGAAVGEAAGLRLVEGAGAGLAGEHLLQQLGALRLGRRALDAVVVRLRLGRRRGHGRGRGGRGGRRCSSIEDVGAGLAEESTSFIGLELCALDVAPMVPSLRAGASVGAVVVVVVVVGAAIGARVWYAWCVCVCDVYV